MSALAGSVVGVFGSSTASTAAATGVVGRSIPERGCCCTVGGKSGCASRDGLAIVRMIDIIII